MERPMHVDFSCRVGPNVAYGGETTETLGCKVWLPQPKRTYARINTCTDDKVSRGYKVEVEGEGRIVLFVNW